VGDVANAAYLATVSPISGVYNVGTGIGLSLRDILRHIAKAVDLEPLVKWLPARSFDVPRIVLDATKLKKITNWDHQTRIDEGVAITADWLRHTEF
jgi:UDP-glucose 4-epimerase